MLSVRRRPTAVQSLVPCRSALRRRLAPVERALALALCSYGPDTRRSRRQLAGRPGLSLFPTTYEQQPRFIFCVRTGTRQPKVQDEVIYSFATIRLIPTVYSFYVRFESFKSR
jgi:hypothetical protein